MTKPTKWLCTQQGQTSLGIRPVWSESSLCAQWVAKDPSFLHADSEDSDKTGRMPRLSWVFAGRTVILLLFSCLSSWVAKDQSFLHAESEDSDQTGRMLRLRLGAQSFCWLCHVYQVVYLKYVDILLPTGVCKNHSHFAYVHFDYSRFAYDLYGYSYATSTL